MKLGKFSIMILALWLFSSSCLAGERWDNVRDYVAEILVDFANYIRTTKKSQDYLEPDDNTEQIVTPKDAWRFSLRNLDNRYGSPESYLGDLFEYGNKNINQLIERQQKLRQVFSEFQQITDISSNTPSPYDSDEYPVLSFLYKIKQAYPSISEEKIVDIFTYNDVKSAKFLGIVINTAHENFLINKKIKVFASLCQLSNDKTVDVLYNRENKIRKLCIAPNKDFPTERQCERIETEEQQKQANFFLELRNALYTDLECSQPQAYNR